MAPLEVLDACMSKLMRGAGNYLYRICAPSVSTSASNHGICHARGSLLKLNSTAPPLIVVFAVDDLGKYLLGPLLQVERTQPTRGHTAHIINHPVVPARGLLAQKTELFAPSNRSVGIDCCGQLGEHLPERYVMIIINPATLRASGLLAPQAGLFKSDRHSVGIDYCEQSQHPGVSPVRGVSAVYTGTRCNYC